MVKTKVIAMYLPQYHRIPENDLWWGEGFTEWTNVKRAKALFDGHIQPRIPLDENYYDLNDPTTLIEQMKLAKKYGVDGFCFYHYWFQGGKKLLERPIENLIKNQEIPQSFCLCWANEPWTRNWDGVRGSQVTLMEQEYGSEDEWELHFEYLKQFFVRDEYIKISDRPILIIYKPSDIHCLDKMIDRWNEMAIEAGLKKLFIISVHRLNTAKEYPFVGDAVMDFEPFATLNNMSAKAREKSSQIKTGYNGKLYKVYDYKSICDICSKQFKMRNIKHYLGCFPGWDNTPRMGDNENVLKIVNNKVEIFHDYFKKQYKKSVENGNELLFINAWNEWGEGAFLEPDTENSFGFLSSIKEVVKQEG